MEAVEAHGYPSTAQTHTVTCETEKLRKYRGLIVCRAHFYKPDCMQQTARESHVLTTY